MPRDPDFRSKETMWAWEISTEEFLPPRDLVPIHPFWHRVKLIPEVLEYRVRFMVITQKGIEIESLARSLLVLCAIVLRRDVLQLLKCCLSQLVVCIPEWVQLLGRKVFFCPLKGILPLFAEVVTHDVLIRAPKW